MGTATLLVVGVLTAAVLYLRSLADDRPLARPTAAAPASPGPRSSYSPSPEASDDSDSGTTNHKIVYEITGKGRATITYTTTTDGDVEQLVDQKLPWKLEFEAGEEDAVPLLGGSADFSSRSDVTCRIRVDGKEIAKEKGPYVTCEGPDH